MTGEALPAEHNGDIWSREATKHGAILTGKNQRFLLGVSIITHRYKCLPSQLKYVISLTHTFIPKSGTV